MPNIKAIGALVLGSLSATGVLTLLGYIYETARQELLGFRLASDLGAYAVDGAAFASELAFLLIDEIRDSPYLGLAVVIAIGALVIAPTLLGRLPHSRTHLAAMLVAGAALCVGLLYDMAFLDLPVRPLRMALTTSECLAITPPSKDKLPKWLRRPLTDREEYARQLLVCGSLGGKGCTACTDNKCGQLRHSMGVWNALLAFLLPVAGVAWYRWTRLIPAGYEPKDFRRARDTTAALLAFLATTNALLLPHAHAKLQADWDYPYVALDRLVGAKTEVIHGMLLARRGNQVALKVPDQWVIELIPEEKIQWLQLDHSADALQGCIVEASSRP